MGVFALGALLQPTVEGKGIRYHNQG